MPLSFQLLTNLDTYYLLILAFLLLMIAIEYYCYLSKSLKIYSEVARRTLVTDNYYNSSLATCNVWGRRRAPWYGDGRVVIALFPN